VTGWRFSVPGKSKTKFLSILVYDKPESLSIRIWLQANGFIKSSFEIQAFHKQGFGQSWLVILRDLAILGKLSSGIVGLGRM
jgi:hypothetical protein